MTRNHGLDALRGWMLVSMTLTHLPTVASRWASQPFGFVSNAEGFVFLSAYLVGRIYSRNAESGSARRLGAPIWRRALKIYGYHIATLLFAFTVAAAIAVYGQRPMLSNLLGFYLEQPWHAVIDSALLIYRPPLMDILPMYVVFMIITPYLLTSGVRRGWLGILTASLLVWVGAQLGLRTLLVEGVNAVSPWPLPPIRHLGAFNIYAWQLLWIGGLWLGQKHMRDPQAAGRIPAAVTNTALILAAAFLALRYALGSYPEHAPLWLHAGISKWNLGLVRMLDFSALTLVCMRFGNMINRWLPTAPLQYLGRASLPVFSVHVVACLLVLGMVHDDAVGLSAGAQIAAIVATFGVMFAVAAFDLRRRQPTGAIAPVRPQA